MTRRERVLGTVLISLAALSLSIIGLDKFLSRIRDLDAKILKAERKIAETAVATRERAGGRRKRDPWTPREVEQEAFLSRFSSIARSAGWNVTATIQREKKDNMISYALTLEGPADRCIDLLEAIAEWDRPVIVEGLSAHATSGEAMLAELEVAYEIH